MGLVIVFVKKRNMLLVKISGILDLHGRALVMHMKRWAGYSILADIAALKADGAKNELQRITTRLEDAPYFEGTSKSAGLQGCRQGVSVPIGHTKTNFRFPSTSAALADAEYVVYEKLGALRLYLDKIYASSDVNWGEKKGTQSQIDALCLGVRKASGTQVDELRLALTTNPPDECLL